MKPRWTKRMQAALDKTLRELKSVRRRMEKRISDTAEPARSKTV